MKTLEDFVRYLRDERLKDLTKFYIDKIGSMDIPIVKRVIEKGMIKNLYDETTFKMTMDSLAKFLSSVQDGTMISNTRASLKLWAENKVPGIGRDEIHPSDLVLIYAAQKTAIFHLLPDFVKSSGEAITITEELEGLYTLAQDTAIQMLFKVQKETEEKLKESEEKFRLMVQNIKDYAIFMITPDGHVQSWNEGAENIKGYKADEILGKYISVFYTNDDIKKGIPESNLKIAGENGHLETEGWRVRKNGEKFWANIIYTALYDEKKKLKGFSKLTRDITKQKQSADDLKAINNFLDSVLENIPNMVFVKDAESLNFVRFNKAGERLLGTPKAELLGKNDHDFFPKEQADFFTGKDRAVLSQLDIVDIPEEPIDTKNGRRWLHTRKIPILNSSGHPVYLLGISEDVTEMRNAKLELERKTHELMRSNTELEQFAYVASHDLQEPLRTVSSYVQLLASRYKDKLDEDANEFIDFAVDGSKRMRQLINSLLEYSRVNRIKPFEWINLTDVLDEIKHDMKEQIEESGAIISYKKMPEIYGDTVLIGQLFQNLIGNAMKFRGSKKPEIRIGSERKNGEFIFSVKDNGIGIPKEYSDKIFVIFQRLNGREKYPGTGIGLSICKKIVERHGGKIWVESEPEKGSAFYFTIKVT